MNRSAGILVSERGGRIPGSVEELMSLPGIGRSTAGAIVLYKKIIDVARKEGDEVTNHLFREILADEEEHHDVFSTLLEEI